MKGLLFSMQNISIKQLKAFFALRDERNFTRAAARVFLSQPAFSALINSLEVEVGFKLFDRDTRSVRITPDGELFKEIALRIMKMHDTSLQEIQDIAHGGRGRVCIAALPSVAVNWLPEILPQFREAYPKIRVELFDAPSDRCLQALENGIADFAVTAFRIDNPDFLSEKIYSEPFYFVCRKDHPLADYEAIDIQDLAGKSIIKFTETTSIRQHLKGKIPTFIEIDTIEVEQLTTMLGLIMAGLGASIIPQLALYQFKVENIVSIPMKNFNNYRDIHLIQPAHQTLSTAARIFCETIRQHALSTAAQASSLPD